MKCEKSSRRKFSYWDSRCHAERQSTQLQLRTIKIMSYKKIFFSQVLHVIDDILVPLTTNQGSSDIYNPDALQFLTNANIFNIGAHRVRSFFQRVVISKKEQLYSADGFHTYFIPVEEGFKVSWMFDELTS